MMSELSDAQLLHYSRHILLPEIDIAGQQRLLNSTVLIVGLGGLGSPVALYLAAAGIGELCLCDHDHVETTNLQRQIIHDVHSIGINKAVSAAQRLRTLNADPHIRLFTHKATADWLTPEIERADLVIDCSDNFPTRYLLNRLCHTTKTPLVSGAAVGFQGQLMTLDFQRDDTPCYACVFPEAGADSDSPCALFGVFAPLVGVIGSSQAAAALRVLLQLDPNPLPKLALYNGLNGEWRTLKIQRDPLCPVCGDATH